MQIKLKNKTALITGAARGIGKSIAEVFARNGADLILVDILPLVNDTASEINKQYNNVNIYPYVMDLRDLNNIVRIVEHSNKEGTKIDILVNNAGICKRNMLLNLSERELFDQFEVNVKGTFFITKVILKQMIEFGIRGKIINIASIMAKIGEAGFSAYSATKHAVLGFSRCLAFEVAPYNICVNAICPGFVDTDMERGIDTEIAREEKKDIKDIIKQYESMVPFGRYANPIDIANTALFLASDESDFITGQGINVSGGLVMH